MAVVNYSLTPIRNNFSTGPFNESANARLGHNQGQTSTYNSYLRQVKSALPSNVTVTSARLYFDLTQKPNTVTNANNDMVILAFRASNVTAGAAGTYSMNDYDASPGAVEESQVFTPFSPLARHSMDVTGIYKTVIENNGAYQGLRLSAETYTVNAKVMEMDNFTLELTYEYILSKPTIITPNGGESMAGVQNIVYSESIGGGIASNLIDYEIQYTPNNGTSWQGFVPSTGAGITTYNVDFAIVPESSLAKIRVRAKYGGSFSEWDESDGVFTVLHNTAPNIPTNLIPSGANVDRTKTNRFTWQHNDSPSDVQSKADLQWRLVGDGLWTDVLISGSETESYFAPNALPNGQIEWRVRTYDQQSLVSPWSNPAVFTSAEPTNAPVIVQPLSVVNIPRPVVEWTGGAQASYQIVIVDSLNAIVWDTGEVISSVKARTVGVDLINGGTYKIKVRVKDGSELFSSYTDKTVNISYTPPATPILEAFKGISSVNLSIEHPTPTGTQPNVINSDVYKLIDDVWVRIAKGINGTYSDYMVASDAVYQYRVVTFGDNNSSVISNVAVQSIKLSGTWLHIENDTDTLHHFKYVELGRSDNRAHDYSKRRYAGRNKPVVVFSEYEERDIQLTFTLLKRDMDWQALQAIYYARQPIVYRDGRGRMLIGILGKLTSTDTFYGNSITVAFEEVDYREGV